MTAAIHTLFGMITGTFVGASLVSACTGNREQAGQALGAAFLFAVFMGVAL